MCEHGWTATQLARVRWLIVWAPLVPVRRLARIEDYLVRRSFRRV